MTFREIARSRCGDSRMLPAHDNLDLMRLTREQIRSYPFAAGHYDHGIFSVLPSETLRFTILRDPVSRYVSAVSHMMRDPAFSHLHETLRELPFDEALLHPSVVMEMRDSVVKLFCLLDLPTGVADAETASRLHLQRGREAIADLDLALANLDTYEVVGTQEQYPESVQLMLNAAGLPPIKVPPVVNPDQTARQQTASPKVLDDIRGQLHKGMALYDYATRRLRDSISTTIFDFAANSHAARQPYVADRMVFDLADLPGGYGWYAPEHSPEGAWLWGGSRDEQGFVLKIRPHSKYVVMVRVKARAPAGPVSVYASAVKYTTQFLGDYCAILIDNDGPDVLLDLAFVCPNGVAPGDGDFRKLSLVMDKLGLVKVDSFEGFDLEEFAATLCASRPGDLASEPGLLDETTPVIAAELTQMRRLYSFELRRGAELQQLMGEKDRASRASLQTLASQFEQFQERSSQRSEEVAHQIASLHAALREKDVRASRLEGELTQLKTTGRELQDKLTAEQAARREATDRLKVQAEIVTGLSGRLAREVQRNELSEGSRAWKMTKLLRTRGH